jgi:hypothetical protein
LTQKQKADFVIQLNAELFVPLAPQVDRTFRQFGVILIGAVGGADGFADIVRSGQGMWERAGIDKNNVVSALIQSRS